MINSYELLPGVVVFEGILDDPQKFTDIIVKSEINNDKNSPIGPWYKWNPWGMLANFDENTKRNGSEDDYILDQIFSKYWEAVKEYKNKYNIDIYTYGQWDIDVEMPKSREDVIFRRNSNLHTWGPGDVTVLKYEKTTKEHVLMNGPIELAMAYHVDRQPWQSGKGKYNHVLTLTFYPNDNYDGGNISFINLSNSIEKEFIDNNGNTRKCIMIDEPITYKPKAGDLTVFPSGQPFYHGVLPVSNGQKYLVRTFLTAYSPETNEWTQGLIDNGLEKMLELEKELIKKASAANEHQIMVFRDVNDLAISENMVPYIIRKSEID